MVTPRMADEERSNAMTQREPLLNRVLLEQLRPTQITVGFREVSEKRRRWRQNLGAEQDAFLGRHMVPVVLGPKDRHYLTDHHHLCRALLNEGVKEVLVEVIADLRSLSKDALWVFLDNRGWCHPYDSDGWRRDFADIPKSLAELTDDPYRSLAGELRRAGGFAKETVPFSEFIWADYLRRRIPEKLIDKDFPSALGQALALSKEPVANFLPGWCGPDPAD